MIIIPTMTTLLLFAEESSQTAIWVAVIGLIASVLGNVVQFLQARRKSESETASLDAQTLKTYVDTIREIQTTNNTLYQSMTVLRDRAETLEAELEESQRHLEECKKENANCAECREYLTTVAQTIADLDKFLEGLTDADESVTKIREISKTILDKVKK